MAVRRYIGMVFQQPNPFAMSIYKNITYGLRINGFRGNYDEVVEKALRGAACGMKSRTSCNKAGCRFPVASSSGSASPERSRSNPKSC